MQYIYELHKRGTASQFAPGVKPEEMTTRVDTFVRMTPQRMELPEDHIIKIFDCIGPEVVWVGNLTSSDAAVEWNEMQMRKATWHAVPPAVTVINASAPTRFNYHVKRTGFSGTICKSPVLVTVDFSIGEYLEITQDGISEADYTVTLRTQGEYDGWRKNLQNHLEVKADVEGEVKDEVKETWLSAPPKMPSGMEQIDFVIQGNNATIIKGQEAQKDRINPTYYKDIVPGMQYMEMMQYMLSRFSGVEAHLMGQIYKYLMRMGGKDSDVQELSKVKWYTDFYLAYLKGGKQPIAIADMQRLLAMENVF
jgi:hypothetical protein